MDSENLNEYKLGNINSNKDTIENSKYSNHKLDKTKFYLLVLLRIFIMCVAAILCWTCNQNENLYLRILFTVLAVVFAEFYILYYSFYHIFMGVKCF